MQSEPSLEELYPYTEVQDSIVEKDWAAGTSKIIESKELLITSTRAGITNVKYPPAWLKIIDEPVVNVLDHYLRNLGGERQVTTLRVDFAQSGDISVFNDGPGIPVGWHSVHGTWLPEVLFGRLYQGSNRYKSEDSVLGGTNGIGAKLTNCFSTKFAVETVDSNFLYMQEWSDHMKSVQKAVVVNMSGCDLSASRAPEDIRAEIVPRDAAAPLLKGLTEDRLQQHTYIRFSPDYEQTFGYPRAATQLAGSAPRKDGQLLPEDYKTLSDVLETRLRWAAAYAEYIAGGMATAAPLRVVYNGAILSGGLNSIVGRVFPGCRVVPVTLSQAQTATSYPPISAQIVIGRSITAGNLNGVVVSGGTHFTRIISLLKKGISSHAGKMLGDKSLKLSSKFIKGNLGVVANATIPCTNWSGQRKDTAVISAGIVNKYVISSADPFAEICEALRGLLMDESIKNEKPQQPIAPISPTHYRPPARYGRRATLLLTEGLSAMTPVAIGVSSSPELGWKRTGLLALGGVIINARNETEQVTTATGTRVKRSRKMIRNGFINSFLQITGLCLDSKYIPSSPTYAAEMRRLRFGRIVAIVDQDLDGTNIFGIIASMFEILWPSLLDAGYLLKFETPQRRAYPKRGGKVHTFYSDFDYADFTATHDITAYTVKYYKGVGTHSRRESVQMFSEFERNLVKFRRDKHSAETFEVYYGSDPDKRKCELRTPLQRLPEDVSRRLAYERMIDFTDWLRHSVKEYQLDNIDRKLLSAIDGMNQCGRKIFHTLTRGGYRDEELKVAQLAAQVARDENYHHGEASLEGAITGKGLLTVGGKQLPWIVPMSNFGSRIGGGSDASSARYIFARFNWRLMNLVYPPEDLPLLRYHFDAGKRYEPRYFVPVLPMAILESEHTPGHGWKVRVFARDVSVVIKNIRRLIGGGMQLNAQSTPPRMLHMPPCRDGFKGRIATIRGTPYSFGMYEYFPAENKLIITELPLRVWTQTYMTWLKKFAERRPDLIAGIIDYSNDINVCIHVDLVPGAVDRMEGDRTFTDPIEETFLLRASMRDNLNLIGEEGEVIEFQDCPAVIHYWFRIRYQLYSERIQREITLLSLKKIYYESLLRFICGDIPHRITVEELTQELSRGGYPRIHRAKLFSPGFMDRHEMRSRILEGPKASYDYILNLPVRKRTVDGEREMRRELSVVEQRLNELQGLTVEELWTRELDAIEQVIAEGKRTQWLFDNHGKFEY